MSHEAKVINFVNEGDADEGFALVRVTNRSIGLTLSLRQDGDIGVFFSADVARSLVAALTQAIEMAETIDI